MRLALDQPDPDIEAARQGILKGGNHADDVTAIIWLYRNFHDFSYSSAPSSCGWWATSTSWN